MLELVISYDSSWRASFLAGSNNEPVKKSRKFIGTQAALKKPENRLYRPITLDTVMGVLNRLIGDRRKLYQARECEDYYFKALERKMTSSHIKDDNVETQELIQLRNTSGSFDKVQMTGIISTSHPGFTNPEFAPVWAWAFEPVEAVMEFILTGKGLATPPKERYDILEVLERLEELSDLKAVEVEEYEQSVIDAMGKAFPDVAFEPPAAKVEPDKKPKKKTFRPMAFYAVAMYLQLAKLQEQGLEFTEELSRNGLIPGLSKRNFTRPDFLRFYGEVGSKPSISTPYTFVDRVKGQGQVRGKLPTACGELTVQLPLNKAEASELEYLIESAGVVTFPLGKKGLAYVKSLKWIEEN